MKMPCDTTPLCGLISCHYQPHISEGCRDVTALSPVFSRGCRGPAHTDGRGCHARCQLHIRSNFGVQDLAQGYFDMQLSSSQGSQDLNHSHLLVAEVLEVSRCEAIVACDSPTVSPLHVLSALHHQLSLSLTLTHTHTHTHRVMYAS